MRLCNCGEKRPFETPPLGKKVCFYVCICMSSITFCGKLKRNPLVCGNFVSKAQLPTYKDPHKKSYKYYEPIKVYHRHKTAQIEAMDNGCRL